MSFETRYLDLETGEIRPEARPATKGHGLDHGLLQAFGRYGAAGRAAQRVVEQTSAVRVPLGVSEPQVVAADRATLDLVDLGGPATTAEVLVEQRLRRAGRRRAGRRALRAGERVAMADYTFLPWARRGLAGRTPPVALDAAAARPGHRRRRRDPDRHPRVAVHAHRQRAGRRHGPRPTSGRPHRPAAAQRRRRAQLPAARRVRPARPAVDVHAGLERTGRPAAAVVRAGRRRPRRRRTAARRSRACRCPSSRSRARSSPPSCPTWPSPGRGRIRRWSRPTARTPARRWAPGRR